MPDSPPSGEALETKQRVRDRLMRERRRRLLRNSVVVFAISLVMLYVALAQRDTQAGRRLESEGDKLAKVFQEALDRSGSAARDFPVKNEQDRKYLKERYALNPYYLDQLQVTRPVGVAVLNEPERMYLKPGGRLMILFDGSRYLSTWMPESEYLAQREKLGFPQYTVDEP